MSTAARPDPKPALARALDALLSVCDGAYADDGRGFNGYDARGARQLRAIGAPRWTSAQTRRLWKMLRKYRRQLDELGIDFDSIPEPELEEASRISDRRIVLEPTGWAIYVPYPRDRALVPLVKRIPGRRYVKNPPRWLIPFEERAAFDLLSFAERHEYAVEEKALGKLRALAEGERPPDRRVYHRPEDDTLIVGFVNLPSDTFGVLVSKMRKAGGRFIRKSREWHFVTDSGSLELVRELWNEYEFELEDAVKRLLGATARQAEARRTEREFREEEPPDVDLDAFVSRRGDKLRPFQRVGVSRFLRWRSMILADDVGLGKTVQALGSAWAVDGFPLVVVCQSDLRLKWLRECWRWVPGRSAKVVEGRSDYLPKGVDIVILSHEVLSYYVEKILAIRPRMLVLDEAHKMKTPSAARSKAAKEIGAATGYRLLLTATPILNRPSELRVPLEIMGRMSDFGGWPSFSRRYCGAYTRTIRVRGGGTRTVRDASGASHTRELHDRLTSTCLLRRLKSEVLSELPDKEFLTVPLEISNRKEYELARDEFLEWIRERTLSDEDLRERLSYLPEAEREARLEEHARARQASVARMLEQQRLNRLKDLSERGKVEAAISWIRSFTDGGRKLIVFAYSRDVQRELYDAFPGAARIFSDDSHAVRQENVDRFQAREDCRLIVCSLIAGQTGHDMTAAYDVAHVGLGWRPADYDQAEGRAWGRLNDPHGITVWYLVAADTVEENVLEAVDKKRTNIDAIVDGRERDPDEDSVVDEVLSTLKRTAREEAPTKARALL